MKKPTVRRGIRSGFLVVAAFTAAVALGSPGSSGSQEGYCKDTTDPEVCECRGGGDLPGPFQGSNLLVELADGDLYTLSGEVILQREGMGTYLTPYLRVNMKAHPWLMNRKRRDFPFYRLEGSLSFWKMLEGARVEISAVAEGKPFIDEFGQTSYDIWLMPKVVYRITE